MSKSVLKLAKVLGKRLLKIVLLPFRTKFACTGNCNYCVYCPYADKNNFSFKIKKKLSRR